MNAPQTQGVTENRLTGSETKSAKFPIGKVDGAYTVDGEQIVRIGRPPFRITNTQVTVAVKNPHLTQAVVLDINGHPKSQLAV